jgi:uncharacterized membrane protein
MSKEDPMAKQAVKEYLHELDQEIRDLPRSRRQELLGEIHEHIDSALAESPAHDEAEVRNVLDRLGDPSDIAEEARQRFGVPMQRSRGLEIAAVILLPIGGLIIPVVGWFIGVILLWSSGRGRRKRSSPGPCCSRAASCCRRRWGSARSEVRRARA